MVKGIFKFSWIFLIGALTWLTACNEESSTTTDDVTTYVEDALTEIRDSVNVGRGHCYELVFPVTLQFPDETTVQVDSFGALKTALREWKEANPDSDERPTLVFPIEVIAQDGTVISIASAEELKELRDSCHFGGPRGPRGGHGGGPGRPHGGNHGGGGSCSCFEIVFPITLSFPDGTTATAADRAALKTLTRAWKAANPTSTERPEMVFPITVKLEDGTTQTVASPAALQALKESCTDGDN